MLMQTFGAIIIMGNANVEILTLEQDIRVLDTGSLPYTFLGKCPPTPPLSQH